MTRRRRSFVHPETTRHLLMNTPFSEPSMNPGDPSREAATDQETLVRITCAVCEHEVPISEAVVPEATDYLVYLCGLDCYQRWRESKR
jgi:hypothetical protein